MKEATKFHKFALPVFIGLILIFVLLTNNPKEKEIFSIKIVKSRHFGDNGSIVITEDNRLCIIGRSVVDGEILNVCESTDKAEMKECGTDNKISCEYGD